MAVGLFQRLWRDCKIAHIFLTRIPFRVAGEISPADLVRATWANPLVGVTVALAAAGAYFLGSWLGLPVAVCAFLAIAASIATTGCFHEDGLADTADGFGGGWTPARKLEIMRDSRLGTYGAAALLLSIGLRASALAALQSAEVLPALLAAHCLSRALLLWPRFLAEPAREEGLAAIASRPTRANFALAAALGTAVAMASLGVIEGLVALTMGLTAAWGMARLARAQIGGYTGDVLGATQQLLEVLVLCFAVALFA